jgi:hypothetical protein
MATLATEVDVATFPQTTVATARSSGGTSLVVASVGSLPTLSGSNYYRLTIANATTGVPYAHLKATQVNSGTNTFTIAGALDGYTDPTTINIGDKVWIAVTAGTINDIQTNLGLCATLAGPNTFAGPTTLNGGVQFHRTVVTSSPYTALATDFYIGVNNAATTTINLPAASTVPAGQVLVIADESGAAASHQITITPNGADTINGSNSSIVIKSNYGFWGLYSNGSTGFFIEKASVASVTGGGGTVSLSANGALTPGIVSTGPLALGSAGSQNINFQVGGSTVANMLSTGTFAMTGLSTALVAKTANYTLTDSDSTVLCDATSGSFAITLISATGRSGRIYTIKRKSSDVSGNTLTITGTIDGTANPTLAAGKYMTIQTDGTLWYAIANN